MYYLSDFDTSIFHTSLTVPPVPSIPLGLSCIPGRQLPGPLVPTSCNCNLNSECNIHPRFRFSLSLPFKTTDFVYLLPNLVASTVTQALGVPPHRLINTVDRDKANTRTASSNPSWTTTNSLALFHQRTSTCHQMRRAIKTKSTSVRLESGRRHGNLLS